MFCVWVSFILLFCFCSVHSLHINFVVLTQQSEYELTKAKALKQQILSQSRSAHLKTAVYFSNEFPGENYGHWSLFPLFERIYSSMVESNSEWLIVVEPETSVKLSLLNDFLSNIDHTETHFIGYGLHDKSPTIIHHFYGYDQEELFEYPDFAAGVALSAGLVKKIAEVLRLKSAPRNDFSIDAKHEVAKLIIDGAKTRLESRPDVFCLFPSESCALTYQQPNYRENDACSNPTVGIDNVFGAVKTFSGNHRTRMVIVKRTWAKELKYIEMFSDIEDHYVPTKTLGIANTERGHCAKTFGILAHFLAQKDDFPGIRWVLIADDDTLLSVPRLFRLLQCYDPKQPFIIGERYGYGFSVDGTGGYDYPTGGSGMVFSLPAVELLVKKCGCPNEDSPDDMIIGSCARSLSIPVIHSAAFHQARPVDYARSYIERIQPISFHKFEDIDPYEVYANLLHEDMPVNWRVHSEL